MTSSAWPMCTVASTRCLSRSGRSRLRRALHRQDPSRLASTRRELRRPPVDHLLRARRGGRKGAASHARHFPFGRGHSCCPNRRRCRRCCFCLGHGILWRVLPVRRHGRSAIKQHAQGVSSNQLPQPDATRVGMEEEDGKAAFEHMDNLGRCIATWRTVARPLSVL